MPFFASKSSYKDRAGRLNASLIACASGQLTSVAAGLWWLFVAIGALMFLIYKRPELYGRRGLNRAIISIQIAIFIGGIFFHYWVDYRPVIVLVVMLFCSVFPFRRIFLIAREINAEAEVSH
jgi:hypothetical protein